MPRPDTNLLVMEDSCSVCDVGRIPFVFVIRRRITHAAAPAAIACLLESFIALNLPSLNETTELRRCSPEPAALPFNPMGVGVGATNGTLHVLLVLTAALASRRLVPTADTGPAAAEPGGIALTLSMSAPVELLGDCASQTEQLRIVLVAATSLFIFAALGSELRLVHTRSALERGLEEQKDRTCWHNAARGCEGARAGWHTHQLPA